MGVVIVTVLPLGNVSVKHAAKRRAKGKQEIAEAVEEVLRRDDG